MRETPDQQVKRDAGSRQGKCVCVCPQEHLNGLYTEVAIWLVSQGADSRYWLARNRALALSHAHSRTFWGCWRMCVLISGVRLFCRRLLRRGRHILILDQPTSPINNYQLLSIWNIFFRFFTQFYAISIIDIIKKCTNLEVILKNMPILQIACKHC